MNLQTKLPININILSFNHESKKIFIKENLFFLGDLPSSQISNVITRYYPLNKRKILKKKYGKNWIKKIGGIEENNNEGQPPPISEEGTESDVKELLNAEPEPETLLDIRETEPEER